MAMAYDLCYDALDPAYREALAREIQGKVFPGLVTKTGGGQHSPRSNHYMAWNGGGGTAILGIEGDPGTDPEIIARANRIFRRRAKRSFHDGHGDRAYFFEGHHCGRLSTNTGFSSYLQALRVAAGEDWITPYPPAQWMLTKWVYELTTHGGRLYNLQRGMYARRFERGGMSSGGDFSQGFGIAPDAHKPAILWTYNHVVEPGPAMTYDAINYPHRAAYAFVNWPVGLEEADPAETFPKVLHDRKAEYFVFRSGWEGDPDIVVTLIGGERRPFAKECLHVMGRGIKAALPGAWTDLRDARLTDHRDGTFAVRAEGASFVVDFSGRSGAPALVAAAGMGTGGRARDRAAGQANTQTSILNAGGTPVVVLTLQEGPAPKVTVEGDRISVGERTLTVTDGVLGFGKVVPGARGQGEG
jgi:hypothetical protein